MSYFLGIYQIITEDDSLTIKFANSNSTEAVEYFGVAIEWEDIK